MMYIDERIKTIQELAKLFKTSDKKNIPADFSPLMDQWENAVCKEHFYHSWFIPEFIHEAVAALTQMMLGTDGHALEQWTEAFRPALEEKKKSRRVGVIMAGNIPLVAFHDFLCTFIAGDVFVGKMSSHDTRLWPLLFEILCRINPEVRHYVELTNGRWGKADVVIATGSNNSTRYFDYYFGSLPHIIRGHCNGVAVLDGRESGAQLKALARDICLYFGLGCRNVSKIYVPENYDFAPLFQAIDDFKPILSQHHSYLNNLEYQKTVHLINSLPFLDQGITMFKESPALSSPISVVHYAYYRHADEVWESLQTPEVQCVATAMKTPIPTVALGETQLPVLNQYANNINTLKFLLS